MTIDQALKIISTEDLRFFNWFGDHEVMPEEVAIQKGSSSWTVFTTDERAKRISVFEYQSESEALEDFIKRLRAQNRFFNNDYR